MAIAVQALRDEGVLDIGGIPGTCFVYVITRTRMCMFHVVELPPRRLDEYGAYRAVYWIERGTPSCRYAAKIGVTEPELRRALLSIGYARLKPAALAQLADARASRKIGNRRGSLVQIADVVDRPPRSRNPTFNDKSATAGLSKKKKRPIFGAVL
jgi:hypothetical protein